MAQVTAINPVIIGRGENLIEAVRRYVEDCDGTDSNDCQNCPLATTALLVTHGNNAEEVLSQSYCELFQELEEKLAKAKAKKGETHAK